ncbi:MAG: LytTR family DNA-binding domain-containing protein [Rubricoccaceae bacterium]
MPDLRILVVDDEAPARQRLLDLLACEDGVEVVGEASSGEDAVECIRADRPDLVFLDVQMRGLTGIDVVREVGPAAMPAVVFVTAYDRHAVEAFELAALDYLLKPYSAERFGQALSRARAVIADRLGATLRDQLAALLGDPAVVPAAGRYATRIAVESRGRVRYVPTIAVEYFVSDGAYVEVHAGENTFLIRDRMQDLEDRLDPADFARVHRSTIVRLDRVESILVGRQGDYAVRLRDGTRLAVARGRRDNLAARLEGHG